KIKRQENSNAEATILKNADVNAAKNILRSGMKMLRIAILNIRNVTREQILVTQFMVAVIKAERVLKWRVCKEKERAAEHAVTACGAEKAPRQRRDKQTPVVRQEPVSIVRREHLAEAS
ncbi:MAG: hypothetical protein J6M06_01910, partial [Synergistaceae bacterium]|nr:hypothetical protein [Synergistaceae bacterium]